MSMTETMPGVGRVRPTMERFAAALIADAARELTPVDASGEPTWVHRARSDGSVISESVTASALRFGVATCGQCSHDRDKHRPDHEPGDDEPWSWCDECGGRCEFVGVG